jgi:hypothetical protein
MYNAFTKKYMFAWNIQSIFHDSRMCKYKSIKPFFYFYTSATEWQAISSIQRSHCVDFTAMFQLILLHLLVAYMKMKDAQREKFQNKNSLFLIVIQQAACCIMYTVRAFVAPARIIKFTLRPLACKLQFQSLFNFRPDTPRVVRETSSAIARMHHFAAECACEYTTDANSFLLLACGHTEM